MNTENTLPAIGTLVPYEVDPRYNSQKVGVVSRYTDKSVFITTLLKVKNPKGPGEVWVGSKDVRMSLRLFKVYASIPVLPWVLKRWQDQGSKLYEPTT